MPIKRKNLTLSYFISTFLVAFVLLLIMFVLTIAYIGISTGFWLSVVEVILGILTIAMFLVISVPIILFLVSFIKTNNAFGGLSSIVGTLIGFISGIYVPLSMLDVVTQNIATALPFSHMAIFMKRLLIGNDILSKLPEEGIKQAGINNIGLFGLNIDVAYLFIGFVALSIGFLVLSFLRLNKKRTS